MWGCLAFDLEITHPKFLKINFPLGLVGDTSDDMGEFSTQIPEVFHGSMTRSIILLDNVLLAPQVSCGEPCALCQPAHKSYEYLMVLGWVQSLVWWTKIQINSIRTKKLSTLIQLPIICCAYLPSPKTAPQTITCPLWPLFPTQNWPDPPDLAGILL